MYPATRSGSVGESVASTHKFDCFQARLVAALLKELEGSRVKFGRVTEPAGG